VHHGGVLWYRFRATFRRRWGGQSTIIVIVGLAIGVPLGIAAARTRAAIVPRSE
jgi:hypothetical protein